MARASKPSKSTIDIPRIDIPKIDIPKLPNLSVSLGALKSPIQSFGPIRNAVVEEMAANYASEFYQRLTKWITDFDANLDEKYEVGVRLVNFGQTVMFHLESLGYWNPSLISFSGTTEDGDPVELIQHVSQISVLLMKMPRRDPEKPKRPIGFHTDNSEGSGEVDSDSA